MGLGWMVYLDPVAVGVDVDLAVSAGLQGQRAGCCDGSRRKFHFHGRYSFMVLGKG